MFGVSRQLSSSSCHGHPENGLLQSCVEWKNLPQQRPRTPITLPIMIALAVVASVKLGAEFGCGIVVAFFGLLRANEVIKVVGMDVIKRSAHCKATTIRLGKTKNNREESIQFGENSVAERALLYALAKNGHVPGRKLFGFRKYSELY